MEHKSSNPFLHAWDGLLWAIKTQNNYRIHLLLSVIVILLGFYFEISRIEWIFVVMAITVGLVIEAFNTAIESTNNAITKEWNKDIKIAKDVAAAAMLTYAIGVVVLSLIIFIPKII